MTRAQHQLAREIAAQLRKLRRDIIHLCQTRPLEELVEGCKERLFLPGDTASALGRVAANHPTAWARAVKLDSATVAKARAARIAPARAALEKKRAVEAKAKKAREGKATTGRSREKAKSTLPLAR